MNNRSPGADPHNNQVDTKKEQGLWKLLRTWECNSGYAIPPTRGSWNTLHAQGLRELDGWRSVETLFEWCRYNPLSIRRERAGHSVDLSAPTVEHHWTSSETRRWRSSSCFKAIKCSDFRSLQAESHCSLHVLIKKCFCSQTPRQPLARSCNSNSISGAYVSGNHFNPGLPPECWLVLCLWAKERFEGVTETHSIADSMLSVFKTPLFYLNNSSHRGRATQALCLLGKPDRRPLLITATKLWFFFSVHLGRNISKICTQMRNWENPIMSEPYPLLYLSHWGDFFSPPLSPNWCKISVPHFLCSRCQFLPEKHFPFGKLPTWEHPPTKLSDPPALVPACVCVKWKEA